MYRYGGIGRDVVMGIEDLPARIYVARGDIEDETVREGKDLMTSINSSGAVLYNYSSRKDKVGSAGI